MPSVPRQGGSEERPRLAGSTAPAAAKALRDSDLGGEIAEMMKAVRDEAAASRKDPNRRFKVRDGHRLWQDAAGSLYRFRCESTLPIPPGSPVTFHRQDAADVFGELVGQEDFEVTVYLAAFSEASLPAGEIRSDPSFVYTALEERLEELLDSEVPEPPREHVRSLLGRIAPWPAPARAAAQEAKSALLASRLNASQLAAVDEVSAKSLHYVWGPPGTGKTRCLGWAVRHLAELGERSLVVAHANVAVDVDALQIADAFEGTAWRREGKVLRVGPPRNPEIRSRGLLTPESVLESLRPALVRRKQELEAERELLVSRLRRVRREEERDALSQALNAVRAELAKVASEVEALLGTIIREATVLVTTLARLAYDQRVRGWPGETLVVDEASMAGFPFLVSAALQPARRRIAVFGDFRQLAPVSLSTSAPALRWLARDPFVISGVMANVDAGSPEERVTLLDTQYRMPPAVAKIVSKLAYGGQLESGPGAGKPSGRLPTARSAHDQPILFLDTSLLGTSCLPDPKEGSSSRVNPMQALLVYELLRTLEIQGADSLAGTTPYRAQALLMDQLLGGKRKGRTAEAATVHRFQGSERDAIVFDFVDGYPAKGLSRLTGRDFDSSRRLLNVALSRTRWKLVVVGNRTFLEKHAVAGSPVQVALLQLLSTGKVHRPRAEDLARQPHGLSLEWFPGWSAVADAVAAEIGRTDGPVVVNWPASLVAHDALFEALAKAAAAGRKVSVNLPLNLVPRLEESSVDILLAEKPVGFFAALGTEHLFLGGTQSGHLYGHVWDPGQVEALLKVLDPVVEALPVAERASEERLDLVSGRCPECGRYRRPGRNAFGDWAIQCSEADHPFDALPRDDMPRLLGRLEIGCSSCGEALEVAEVSGGTVRLRCTGEPRGCPGPRSRDLADYL